MTIDSPQLVSVHGGHSGQFCNHASDNLEEIIQKYIDLKFSWVGITEHTPGISDQLLYPDEKSSESNIDSFFERFSQYITECRRLQKKYEPLIKIFVAMEIETYSGYQDFVPHLLKTFQPDYIVGSVHFVNDICFDYSKEFYAEAVMKAGNLEKLYCNYFDAQFEMINLFEPAVVGHFDLIRIFDEHYKTTFHLPTVQESISRNLNLIKDKGLILDFNLRALLKGAQEPYISRPILKMAKDLNIPIVPGDDSHGCSSVGGFMHEGITILQDLGFPTDWAQPKTLQY